MACTKGIGFLNVQAFITERFGGDAWQAVVAKLPPEDQRTIEGIVSPGWYDLGLYAHLLHVIEELHGNGDPRFLHTLGRFEAERDISTVTRWILRLFRPSVAIEQMGKYWNRFHDTGRWSIHTRTDRLIVARLEGWGVIDAALCRELAGYLGRSLELLGGRDVAIEHTRCRARGGTSCEFRARWHLRRDEPAEPLDPDPAPRRRSDSIPPSASPSAPPSRPPPQRSDSIPPSAPPSRPPSTRLPNR